MDTYLGKGRFRKTALKAIAQVSVLGLFSSLVVLGTTLGTVQVALAGPDAKKIVNTKMHVDSPRVYWEKINSTGEGATAAKYNFVLRAKAGFVPEGTLPPRIEETVNWVGKGWRYGLNGEVSQYTFVVPQGSGYEFLGKPGTVLYNAPALPDMTTYEPTWQGIGADEAVPSNRFRDEKFTLDLVDAKGPGNVDWFTVDPGVTPGRILSSYDPAYRFSYMTAGNHTHNETSFSRPGRYELTFRASARTKDGVLVQSAPQTVAYQIGGVSPDTSHIVDVVGAFNKSNDKPGNGAGQPVFSLSKYASVQRDADQFLTTLSFNTGNLQDSGTVVFTINGFYLTEIKVENGKAEWNEMLGDLSSTLQAIYIPESGPTPRWISAPVNYQREQDGVNVQTASDTLVEPSKENLAPKFPVTETEVMEQQVTINANIESRSLNGFPDSVIKIKFANFDPNMYGLVHGEFVDPNEEYNVCTFDMNVGGKSDYYTELWGSGCSPDRIENFNLNVDVYPHPLIKGKAVHYKQSNVSIKNPFSTQFKINKDGGAEKENGSNPVPTPSPSVAPTPNPDGNNGVDIKPSENDTVCTKEKPCEFTKGHVDVFHVKVKDGSPYLNIKEDITGSEVQHEANEVILKVTKAAYYKDDFSRIVPEIKGSVYALPQNQDQNIIWPGWDTLALSPVFSSAKIVLDQVEAPEQGKVYAYMTTNFGQSHEAVTTDKKLELHNGSEIWVPRPAHAHINWIFTKAGIYKFHAHVEATKADGAVVKSNSAIYTWNVDATNDTRALVTVNPGDIKNPDFTPKRVEQGSAVELYATGMNANQLVTFELHSDPLVLAKVTADASGVAQAMAIVPSNFPTGLHNIVATQTDSSGKVTSVKQNLTVVPASKPGNNSGDSNSGNNSPGGSKLPDGSSQPGGENNQQWRIVPMLKDDRQSPPTWVRPESLTFALGKAAKAKLPAGVEFLAPMGSEVYLIGSTQVEGVPWLGANTQHESVVKYVDGGVIWQIQGVEGPGKIAVFESGNFGQFVGKRWFDNVGGPTSVMIPHNTHVHPNWVFSAPGKYTVTLKQIAKLKNGETVSGNLQLHFVVGQDNVTNAVNNGHFDLGSIVGKNSDISAGSESGVGDKGNSITNKPSTGNTQTSKGNQHDENNGISALKTNSGVAVSKIAGNGTDSAALCRPVRVTVELGANGEQKTESENGKTARDSKETAGTNGNSEGSSNLGNPVNMLVAALKDDRATPAKWVKPDSVVFGLSTPAMAKAPAGIEFIAKPGSTVYMIGSTQVAGVPWLGANTQHPSVVKGVSGGVTWTLNSVNGPGKLAVFESGNFGQFVGKRWFDNVGGPTSVVVPHNTHVHPNWVFSAPGKYQVTLTQSARLNNGKEISGVTTLNFNVGGLGNANEGHFDLGAQITAGVEGAAEVKTAIVNGKQVVQKVVGRMPDGSPCELPAGSLAHTGSSAVTLALVWLGAGIAMFGLGISVHRNSRKTEIK